MRYIVLAFLLLARPCFAQSIVCAENFYGDVAQQIAGPGAGVISILSNPDQDPHMFEASPSVARAIAAARIVVISGVGYDPWAEKLLRASPNPNRTVIEVGALVHRQPGDNPHIWYDPATMVAFAQALAAALDQAEPAHRAEIDQRRDSFLASLAPVTAKIAALKARAAGAPVTATEPVFGLMAQALGLAMRNERFQLAVMNDTEPAASDIAAFEADLQGRRVRILFYNSQATDSSAKRLLGLAHRQGIPVVGVSETEPKGMTYQQWMTAALDAVDAALK